jgi:DNA-binding transcriptional regulator YhcF (GntR family)
LKPETLDMDITIDRSSVEPPYRQIREQIRVAITDGELAVGTRLPAVRALAEKLGVAPGTVARAYRELEVSGLLDTRGRHGTHVADPRANRFRRRRELAALAADYAATALRWAIPPAEAINVVEQAFAEGHSPG